MLKSFLNFHKNHHSPPAFLGFLKGVASMMLSTGTQAVFDLEDGLMQ